MGTEGGSIGAAKEKRLMEGELLFRIGDPVLHIHEIVTGRIKMTRFLADGTEVILHFVGKGEIVAEASLFSTVYHCNAVATVDTTVRGQSKIAVLNQLQGSPEFATHYVKVLSRQVQRLRLLTEVRSIRSANSRILRYLNLEANATGHVSLDCSLKDVANRIGLTHETFYRELKKLEASGRIERTEKTIRVCGPI